MGARPGSAWDPRKNLKTNLARWLNTRKYTNREFKRQAEKTDMRLSSNIEDKKDLQAQTHLDGDVTDRKRPCHIEHHSVVLDLHFAVIWNVLCPFGNVASSGQICAAKGAVSTVDGNPSQSASKPPWWWLLTGLLQASEARHRHD